MNTSLPTSMSTLGSPAMTSSRRPLIVWCAGASWSGIAGTDRHMALALAKFVDILWIDPAISPVTPERFRHGSTRWPSSRLAALSPTTFRLTPKAIPFHSRGILRSLTASLTRQQIRHALKKIGRTPHAVVVSHLDDLLVGYEPNVLKVFYGTDDYVGGAELMGSARRQLEREEFRQLRRADVVISISNELAERWRNLGFTGSMHLIPNGVDVEHYRNIKNISPIETNLPKPIAGFVGHLSARIDIGLLEAVVAAGSSLLLVGPHNPPWEAARFQTLIAHPRVSWVGPVPFDELPRYLAAIDVGITPYIDSNFNKASFPLKTLEYLAAGKSAVSTNLPAVHWLASDLISVASHRDFGRTTLVASKISDRITIERRVDFATTHSWTRRAEAFGEALGISQISA